MSGVANLERKKGNTSTIAKICTVFADIQVIGISLAYSNSAATEPTMAAVMRVATTVK